jgi:hypothetical protein
MKELIKTVEKREELFLPILSHFLNKKIDKIEEKNVKIKNNIYHLFYDDINNIIIIDGIFHEATDAILMAEEVAKAVYAQYDVHYHDMIDITFVSSYIDNTNLLNFRAFKFENFNGLYFGGIKFPRNLQFTKDAIITMLKGVNQ